MEALCAVATELTELVETNEALRVTESSLRQLSGRLLQLQDEERRRIARETFVFVAQSWLDQGQLPPGSDPAAAALAVSYLLPGILVERQLGGRAPAADRLLAGLAAISWSGPRPGRRGRSPSHPGA